jgi:hypothetical protein
VLWTLDAADVRRLRASEAGSYEWSEVTVECEGAPVSAHTLTNRRPVAGRLPSRRYRDLLLRGAREEGLPPSYVERLAAEPCVESVVADGFGRALMGTFWLAGKARRLLRPR